ncbi:hypothetical protein BATDEDRAFT_85179 [Batrachochytrium dendrobatidis JAM81]|uniref:Uncharacterized protein n=1 Tax=Batrachochytrium dendrobatidis (strain JAM81 / FGSC 10211) TaxID=684364 RepID=F4NV52_BATDJ|nr:uncharacterized protein BATDEDRAFT_85179 [Batrachochytrium dendrobatidis JAM81]EGF84476.1 hypothetical protein BATDEDRAFT_85179 [Batrachochytrium dendrobatidis JAM81]|eukprot:XP_006676459.1 hypothetical protein BATDEDRAFT_85179 [Batrachochytrium dendrobatidis JAM81]
MSACPPRHLVDFDIPPSATAIMGKSKVHSQEHVKRQISDLSTRSTISHHFGIAAEPSAQRLSANALPKSNRTVYHGQDTDSLLPVVSPSTNSNGRVLLKVKDTLKESQTELEHPLTDTFEVGRPADGLSGYVDILSTNVDLDKPQFRNDKAWSHCGSLYNTSNRVSTQCSSITVSSPSLQPESNVMDKVLTDKTAISQLPDTFEVELLRAAQRIEKELGRSGIQSSLDVYSSDISLENMYPETVPCVSTVAAGPYSIDRDLVVEFPSHIITEEVLDRLLAKLTLENAAADAVKAVSTHEQSIGQSTNTVTESLSANVFTPKSKETIISQENKREDVVVLNSKACFPESSHVATPGCDWELPRKLESSFHQTKLALHSNPTTTTTYKNKWHEKNTDLLSSYSIPNQSKEHQHTSNVLNPGKVYAAMSEDRPCSLSVGIRFQDTKNATLHLISVLKVLVKSFSANIIYIQWKGTGFNIDVSAWAGKEMSKKQLHTAVKKQIEETIQKIDASRLWIVSLPHQASKKRSAHWPRKQYWMQMVGQQDCFHFDELHKANTHCVIVAPSKTAIQILEMIHETILSSNSSRNMNTAVEQKFKVLGIKHANTLPVHVAELISPHDVGSANWYSSVSDITRIHGWMIFAIQLEPSPILVFDMIDLLDKQSPGSRSTIFASYDSSSTFSWKTCFFTNTQLFV